MDIVPRETSADQVFKTLHTQILSLELRPCTKLSEVEVATAMGVSRQPVREAFFRLSQLGFVIVRPQRATMVSPISVGAIMEARFIRTAIETATVKEATKCLKKADFTALENILARQLEAVAEKDGAKFHGLDDQFHREICRRAGVAFAWEIISAKKSHMDRVRVLSLELGAMPALRDHERILEAMKRRDPEEAARELDAHLARIVDDTARIRADNESFFVP